MIETTLFCNVVIFYESVYSDYYKFVTLVYIYETFYYNYVIFASSLVNLDVLVV